MSAPDLFTPQPRARNADPATSHAAAQRAREFVADHHALILGVLWRPMTAPEIGKLVGMTMEQVCRRLPELETMGGVRPTGRTRAGPTGRQCREWEKVMDST